MPADAAAKANIPEDRPEKMTAVRSQCFARGFLHE